MKDSLRRGLWSPEEDEKLRAYVKRYGIWNWTRMPEPAGLSRTGKSCRLRWLNYLRPGIKLGNYTIEEEETIIRMHKMVGNRWSRIAAALPGRTDNEIKNLWHTKLKKSSSSTTVAERNSTSPPPTGLGSAPDTSTSNNSVLTTETCKTDQMNEGSCTNLPSCWMSFEDTPDHESGLVTRLHSDIKAINTSRLTIPFGTFSDESINEYLLVVDDSVPIDMDVLDMESFFHF